MFSRAQSTTPLPSKPALAWATWLARSKERKAHKLMPVSHSRLSNRLINRLIKESTIHPKFPAAQWISKQESLQSEGHRFKSVSRLSGSDRLQRSGCNGSWRLEAARRTPWVDYGLTNGLIKNVANSRRFKTPTNHNLTPRHPPRTPPSQVLALGNQTLVNRTSQQGDAVPAHLITKVLASHANP